MTKRIYTQIAVCLLVVLFWGNTAHAQARNFHVSVGYSYFPPWQITKNNNWVGGLDKIVLDAWIKELAHTYDIHLTLQPSLCPLKRCLRALETGNLDMKTGLLKRADREKYLYFIEPAYQVENDKAVYLREKDGEDFDIHNYEELRQYRIGFTRASKNFPRFDKDLKIKKIETSGTLNGLEMLCAKRFDAFIGTELVVDYFIAKKRSCDKIHKATFKYIRNNPGYFAISQQSSLVKVLPELNKAMQTIVDRGVLNEAIQQVNFSD